MNELELLKDETFIIYGKPKAGKSTIASCFHKPLFIATEPGLKYIKVDEKAKKYVYTWSEYLTLVETINKETHDYFTYIIDTLDNLWLMCCDYICTKADKDHPSEIGSQGKGWSMVRDEFRTGLQKLQDNTKCLVLIAHSQVKEIGKEQVKYSYMTLNLPGKAIEAVCGWTNHILLLSQDADGNRFMYTDGNKYFEAGSRNPNLRSKGKIKLDYQELLKAMEM